MKNRMPAFLSLVVFMCIVASIAVAQQNAGGTATAPSSTVPGLIAYSGILKDASGEQRNSVAGVTFLLYRDEQGGAPLWMETQNVVPDKSGHYSVQLGAATANGLPANLFQTGEARWLAVQIAGEAEQARVMLVAVPYAMKAAEAETLGGLPASAFVLAAPPTGEDRTLAASASASAANPQTVPTAAAVTGSGTANYVPLWTGASTVGDSVLYQTGSGATAKIGINTSTPGVTLDVKGAATIRGTLTLPAPSAATATAGKNSQPLNFAASVFNSGTGTAVGQTFRWQAEPAGNNTTSAAATLNLLFASGSNAPAETGLKIANNGRIAFAPGQTFPGTGTGSVESVALTAPASDFTVSGSPVTSTGTLALNWTVAPTSAATDNAIVKRDASGNFAGNVITASALSVADVYLSDSLNIGGSSIQPLQVVTSADNAAGVSGYVMGTIGEAFGVYGEINSSNSDAAGVSGVTTSSSSTGVLGVQYSQSTTGAGHGYSAGVWGDSEKGIGTIGTADDSNAMVGVNNSPTGYTTAFLENESTNAAAYVLYTNGSSFNGGHCSVDVKGNLACSGSTSAVVPLDGGTRKVALSTIESPQSWFEDFGSAQLVNGVAVVPLDPDFIQTVNAEVDYKVFPVPDGDCKGLYVARKTATSFEVRELGGGTSSVSFDYRVTALRRNYENVRFADHTNDPVPFVKPAKVGVRSAQRQPLPVRPTAPANTVSATSSAIMK
jgi:hypothetical protein